MRPPCPPPSACLRFAVLLALPCLALMGCPSTRTCPNGQAFAALDGGGHADVCTPSPSDGGPVDSGSIDGGESDGGLDAGPDAGPPDAGADAGPCGECNGETPHCNAGTGECVGCVDDDHCIDTARPVCDTTPHECVQCVTNDQCNAASSSRCDTAGLMCHPP